MKNTEKRFRKAEMKVVRFDESDVIATSGPFDPIDPVDPVNTPHSLAVSLFMTHDAVNSGGTDNDFWS